MSIIKFCEKTIFYAFFILIAASPIVFTTYSDDIFRTPKEVFTQIVIVIIISSWLIKIIEKSSFFLNKNNRKEYQDKRILFFKIIQFPFALPILILLSVSIVSLLQSPVLMISIKDIINITLYSILYFMVVSNIKNYKQIHILIIIAIAIAAFTASFCIAQYYGHDPLFYPKNPADKGSILSAGFMDNPNLVAGYMAILIPLALYKTISSHFIIIKAFFFLSYILIFFGIVVTANRTSLATAIISSVFFLAASSFFTYRETGKKKIIFFIVLLTLGFAILTSAAYKKKIIHSILSVPAAISGSSNDRILYWKATGEIIKKYPLTGTGIGTFKLYYMDYRKIVLEKWPYFGELERAEQAHNDYLQLWAETGIFGLLTALWIIIYYFYSAFKFIRTCKKENRGYDSAIMMIGFVSSIITVLLYALTCFPFHIVPTSVLFVFLVGMTVWIMRQETQRF